MSVSLIASPRPCARICFANDTRRVNSYFAFSATSFVAKLNVNGGGGADIRPRSTPRQKIPSPLFRTQIRHSTNIQTRLTPRNKHVGSKIFTGSVAHRVVIGHVAELRRFSHVGQVRFPVGPFLRPELAVDEGA